MSSTHWASLDVIDAVVLQCYRRSDARCEVRRNKLRTNATEAPSRCASSRRTLAPSPALLGAENVHASRGVVIALGTEDVKDASVQQDAGRKGCPVAALSRVQQL